MQNNWLNAAAEATRYLKQYRDAGNSIGIVLGTGLGAFIDHMVVSATVPYAEIPHFPAATVESHKGQLVFGRIGSTPVIAMQGRFHYYEGYSLQQVTFSVRVLKALGVEALFLSNASGGLDLSFRKGDLVLLDDHINLLPDNPIRGLNTPDYGKVFPDMSCPYDKSLSAMLKDKAGLLNLELKKGIYAAVMGPNLETRAEYRFLRVIGADLVGMSTVPEVIVANQIGLPCAAISVVTDECDPENLVPVDISEIIAVAGKADARLSKLLAEVIRAYPVHS